MVLGLLHVAKGLVDMGSFGKIKIDVELAPWRIGKKHLLDVTEPDQRDNEQSDHDSHRDPAETDAR
jgi:hypothetical protein